MLGGSSPDLVRAEREARIAARVNHPHVVAVFDLVHEGDQKWLVMEYVEGMTLAEHIQATGPPERVRGGAAPRPGGGGADRRARSRRRAP